MKFKKTTYSGISEILATKDFEGINVMVSDSGVVANADGLKIVTAGTPIGGDTKAVLLNRQEPVVIKNTQGGATGTAGAGVDAEGVLLYDVDVTEGPAPGSMVIKGNINENKMPVVPVTDVKTALKGRVVFMK